MSWESELGKSIKYGRWPNPFDNMIKRIDVLACEGEFLPLIEMYGIGFGNWFWTNFVPSPYEIIRKTVTGSYRCGFYGPIKLRSPLDIIWRDGRTSRVLGSILSPLTKGLFYIWGAQTLWDALQTWQTLQYAQEACDWDGNTTVLANASAPWNTENGGGSLAFATTVYDPRHRANPNICQVGASGTYKYQCYWAGTVTSQGHEVFDFTVGFDTDSGQQHLQSLGAVLPFESKSFVIEWSGVESPLSVQPYWEGTQQLNGVFPTLVQAQRFVVNAFPPDYPNWQPNTPLQDLSFYTAPKPPLCSYYE